MQTETQQAQDALSTITQAQITARRHSPNNGTVPLIFGGMVLACMTAFDLLPFAWAVGLSFTAPVAASVWTVFYQRRLPVKPLKTEKSLMITFWGVYHVAVLLGGMALGTRFWRTDCLPHGEWTLLGVFDAAPLFWVGWSQRWRTEAGR